MRKKIIVKLLVLSLLVGGLCQWSGGSKAKAVRRGNVLTKSDGDSSGCRIKMYYRGGKLIVKGRMRKSKKKANCENGKKIASKTRKFKVSSKCQVIECEGLEEYAYGIKSYMRERGIKGTKNWANISNRIKVVNGKVTKIYLSA